MKRLLCLLLLLGSSSGCLMVDELFLDDGYRDGWAAPALCSAVAPVPAQTSEPELAR